MPEPLTIQKLQIANWTVKARIPKINGPHKIMLLLHGWKGNEDVMWVFSTKIPEDYLLIAPRGIYPAPGGGYSWANRPMEGYSDLEDFNEALGELIDLLSLRPGSPNQVFDKVSLMGFSQGAALAYSFAAKHPQRVDRVIGLAGFVPKSIQHIPGHPYIGTRFFVAHGTQDDIVPLQHALEGIRILENAGAQVLYCESNVGHKLGADCLNGLEAFLSRPSLQEDV